MTVVNILVIAAAYPIYLYFLGYEKYGIWLVLTTVLAFAQLGDIGISPAIMKLVAEEYGRNDIKSIQRYITTALAMLVISGTFILIVLLALKNQIVAAFKLSDENAQMVLWLLPYISVLSIYVFIVQVFESVLSGLGRMDLTNYILSIGRVVNLAVAGLLMSLGFDVKSLLIGSIVSYFFIHIASVACIRRIIHIHLMRIDNLDTRRGKDLLRFGSAMFGGSLISMLLSPFNKLMLSRYTGVSTIPVYEIAFTGSMYVKALIQTSFRALMPEISRLSSSITSQAKNRILQLNHHAMKLIVLFGIPVYVILVALSPVLLRVWLADRCVETLPGAFRIMLIGTFLSLLSAPAYYTLMGLGRVNHCFLSQVIQGIVNAGIVGLFLMFVGTVSIHSIASSVVAAMGVTAFYLILQNRRVLQNDLNVAFDQTNAVSTPDSSYSEI